MAMGKQGNTPSKEATKELRGGDNAAGRDDSAVDNPSGSAVPEDHVAVVSRNADGSDAQPNRTVRIIDADSAEEADKAQLDAIGK